MIEATVKRQGNISAQSKLVPKSKLKLIKASSLISGDWFYQVYSLHAVRRLKYSPEELTDPKKYRRELDIIGVWILRTASQKKIKAVTTKLNLGL